MLTIEKGEEKELYHGMDISMNFKMNRLSASNMK